MAYPLGLFHAPRHAVLLAAVGTLMLPVVASCLAAPSTSSGDARTASASNVAVRIGKAVRGDLSGVLALAGDVRAKGQILIVPRVTARLDKLYVDVGSRVRQGDPLADLDRSELETQVLQAQAAQSAAEAKLAQLKAGPRPELVVQADANLRAAQARVQALEAARSGSDVAALQRQRDEARARLDRLRGGPSEQQVGGTADTRAGNASPAAIDQAQLDVQQAELALFFARLSSSAFDLDQARALVDAAQAQMQLVGQPATPDEIRAAEANAEQAFALAELARARLRDTTILAPASGVVTEVSATPGSTVGPSAALLTLIPPELQITVSVDESQAAQLQTGQSVVATVETFPQEIFNGVVKGIAPVLDPRTRQVAVKVEVSDPQGKLRPGMFAQVAVHTGQRQGVTLVPKEAVIRLSGDPGTIGQAYVFAVVDSRLRRQRVVTGALDSRSVEIVQGIGDGADVVLNPRADFLDGELITGAASR